MYDFEQETPEEFNQRFWEFISEDLVSNEDLLNNDDWQRAFTYKLWKRQRNSDVDIAYIYTIAKDILEVNKLYNPLLKK